MNTNKCEQCGGFATDTEYLCEGCLMDFQIMEHEEYLKYQPEDFYERCVDCGAYLDASILRYCTGCHAPICIQCEKDFSGFCRECWSESWSENIRV